MLDRETIALDIDGLKKISKIEFADIVKSTHIVDYKLRIILINDSFIDIHLSQKLPDRFGFHWECMDAKGGCVAFSIKRNRRIQGVHGVCKG
jgi:hypothetical protein